MGDGFYRSKDPTNSIKVLKGGEIHKQIVTIKNAKTMPRLKHNRGKS